MSSNDTSLVTSLPAAASAQVARSGSLAWVVLAGLILLGLVGGLGGLPSVADLWTRKASLGASAAGPSAGAREPTRSHDGTQAAPAASNALPPDFPTHLLARGLPADKSGPKTIEARHVLVQYRGSWHAVAAVTRTKEEAFGLAEQALLKLKKGEDFESVVQAYTDSADVKKRKGVLGVLDRDTAMRAIAEPAFALKVGEYSEVVESPFGFHVIQRTK